MGSNAPRRGGRRVPAPPSALTAELVRARLLDQLVRRFEEPVTVIVAGAGFGKSTLLAQAIRANHADPRGIDTWLSCEPGDGDAGLLADVIVASLARSGLDRRSDGHQPLERVLGALADAAPIDVCLVIDDIHEIPRKSPAALLLAAITADLPPHAHLVFAGRTPPPVPLAGRRAAGEVVEIGLQELTFTATEVAALGRLLGREAEAIAGLDRLAGWPSLVRLALSAPAGAAPQFLWEEVVADLSSPERRAVVALATLGRGTAADVAFVAGDPESAADRGVDLDALVAKVPLLRRDADGWYGAHDLWADAVERIVPVAQLRAPRQRALALFAERGETVRTGWSALRWGDGPVLCRAARALVRETIGSVPVDTAARWLANAPEAVRGSPDLGLLQLAVLLARRFDDPGLDADIDALFDTYRTAGDRDGAVLALTFATAAAHMRGDLARILAVDASAGSVPGAADDPVLQLVHGLTTASRGSLEGDPEAAVDALEALAYDDAPAAFSEFAVRLHASMLCLCGRADEAAAIADRLTRSSSPYARTVATNTRWMAGDPSVYPTGRVDVTVPPGTCARHHLFHANFLMAAAASFGDRAAVAAVRPLLDAAVTIDSRDRAILAFTTALGHLAEHDELSAARVIGELVDTHSEHDRVADVRLRRLLAPAYVLDDRVRRRWRDAPLGPSLRRQRRIADDLLAARAGTLAADCELAPAGQVLTTLPLVWSAELAARAVAAGCESGFTLAAGLAALAPAALRTELELASAASDPAVRDGATRLLSVLPDASEPPLRIGVLGTLTVSTIDGDVPPASLRRRRVRTLVELLALGGPLRRDRIADLIWPDLDPEAANANLRVTLSRLRAVLEPESSGRRRCEALRVDGDVIALAPGCVEVDWWEFQDDLAAADSAGAAGDTTAMLAALERACSRWRGAPFADIDPIDELVGTLEEVRRQLVDTALRLGEQLLVVGRFDDAAAWAARVVRDDPYTERAHRLAIAAHLQRHDHHAISDAVATATAMLAELGVDPEPPTRMLLRQAEARIGSLATAP